MTDEEDQFVSDIGTSVDAWVDRDEDRLCICTGDGVLKLERNKEVAKFIEFILKVNAEVKDDG